MINQELGLNLAAEERSLSVERFHLGKKKKIKSRRWKRYDTPPPHALPRFSSRSVAESMYEIKSVSGSRWKPVTEKCHLWFPVEPWLTFNDLFGNVQEWTCLSRWCIYKNTASDLEIISRLFILAIVIMSYTSIEIATWHMQGVKLELFRAPPSTDSSWSNGLTSIRFPPSYSADDYETR